MVLHYQGLPKQLMKLLINEKVEIIDMSGFIANAIRLIHSGGSLVDLNQEE